MAEGTGKGSSRSHTPHTLSLSLSLGEWGRGSARGRLPLSLLIAADTAAFQRWRSGSPSNLGDGCSSQGPCQRQSRHTISSSMKRKIAQPEQGKNESRCVLGMTKPAAVFFSSPATCFLRPGDEQ